MPLALAGKRQVCQANTTDPTPFQSQPGTKVLRIYPGANRAVEHRKADVKFAQNIGRIGQCPPVGIRGVLPGHAATGSNSTFPEAFQFDFDAIRVNCIQNQITIAGKVLLQNKVVGAIITGGQDNVQAVAGQMLGFFGELGCQFPQFPYIAHSRGWSAEDMERNIDYVKASEELHSASRELVDRSVNLAERLLATTPAPVPRAGRKGRALPVLQDK